MSNLPKVARFRGSSRLGSSWSAEIHGPHQLEIFHFQFSIFNSSFPPSLSLTTRFSGVGAESSSSRTVSTVCVQRIHRHQPKPLKRLTSPRQSDNTRLKQGVNEISERLRTICDAPNLHHYPLQTRQEPNLNENLTEIMG